MDLHDRKAGVEPIRPAKTPAKIGTAPDMSAAARAESGLSARPAPAQKMAAAPAKTAADGKHRLVAAHAQRHKRPRSEARRVGKEWVSTCRYRWAPDH